MVNFTCQMLRFFFHLFMELLSLYPLTSQVSVGVRGEDCSAGSGVSWGVLRDSGTGRPGNPLPVRAGLVTVVPTPLL